MDISKMLTGSKLSSKSGTPMYIQIASILADKVNSVVFPVGTKLPPERELAELFGVSRTTAINAYRYLEQRGMVVTRVGSGTYVAGTVEQKNEGGQVPWAQLMTTAPRFSLSSIMREIIDFDFSGGSISLAAGMPDPALYPVGLLRQVINQNNKNIDPVDLGHIATEGYAPLRSMVPMMLGGRGIEATGDSVMITAGSQQGLYLISKALLEPGDYVVVEAPTFIGAHQVFSASGARILGLPAAGAFPFGLLEDYLVRYRPKLLYLLPTFHNPTGRVMPEPERKELLRLAARYRLVVVEDDPYSELYYEEEPPLSLKAMDNYGGVIYLSTYSKILFPGLRTGYLVADPVLINRMALEKQFIDLHSNNLAQWLLCVFLESGALQEHLALVRTEYKRRRDVLAKAVQKFCGDRVSFEKPRGGFYLWCRLTRLISAGSLLHEAAGEGVSFVPGEAFYANSQESEGEIRLCFATHAEKQLQEGARRLARAMDKVVTGRKGKNDATPGQPVKPII